MNNQKLVTLASKRCDFICIFYALGIQLSFLMTNPFEQFIGNYAGWAGFVYIGIAWGSAFVLLAFLDPYLAKKAGMYHE